MPERPLTFETKDGPFADSTAMELHGPVLISNLFNLQAALRSEESKVLLVDLSDVPYMDSAGLGTLINAYVSRQNRGKSIAIIAPNERIQALLKVTKMDTVLPIFKNTADVAV